MDSGWNSAKRIVPLTKCQGDGSLGTNIGNDRQHTHIYDKLDVRLQVLMTFLVPSILIVGSGTTPIANTIINEEVYII